MSQLYCAVRSVPLPFVLRGGGSASSSVQLVAPVTLTWQSGSPDTWTPGPTFVVQPAAFYGLGGPTCNTLSTNWLIVAVQGTPAPVLVKEQDYPNTGTVVGGGNPQWAALYLVTGTQIVPIPQRMAGSLPTPYLDNAILSVDPTTHQPYWELPSPGDLLLGSLSPITHLPVWERLPVPTSGSGQVLTYVGAGVVAWAPDEDSGTTPTPSGTTPPGTVVASSTGANTKVLPLWNGGSNNTPPIGWTSVAYDDSGWQTPFAGLRTDGFPMVATTKFVCTTGGATTPQGVPAAPSATAAFLLRQHVRLAAPLPAQFALTVSEDNIATALVNGREVYYYNRPASDTSPAHAVQFASSGMSSVDDNVLCFYILNGNDPGAFVYGVSYALSAD